MGNACCNNSSVDPKNEMGGKTGNGKEKPGKRGNEPEMQKLLEDCKKDEAKITKLQANWRGHNTRKHMKDGAEDEKNKPRASARLS